MDNSYVCQLYDDSSGMMSSESKSVIQSNGGYVWIGGYSRLTKFGGDSFCEMSTTSKGMKTLEIRKLF